MWEPADTTTSNAAGFNSQTSFYEYPSHKPFINSIHPPLRSAQTLSKTAALPESNRDHLLTALQSLSLRIKELERDREQAEIRYRQIAGELPRPLHRRDHLIDPNSSGMKSDEKPTSLKKNRTSRKKKKSSANSRSFETATPPSNPDARHYHLDLNSVPFILGGSIAPSHNVKSNVQNVIALLKNHNQQLCLTSKEYADILNPHSKDDLPPHTVLYLDHCSKSSLRPASASPVRRTRKVPTKRRPYSATRRSPTSTLSEQKSYAKVKELRQKFATLAREHRRLTVSRSSPRELEIISKRMTSILEELEPLQKQLKLSIQKSSSKDHLDIVTNETPLETLRKTRLLQVLLRDPSRQEQHRDYLHRRIRPNSND